MFTLGGATSGYCAIGSRRIAATPASMMTIESTHAKTGRFAKKRASMSVACLGRSRTRGRSRSRCLVRVHRHSGPDLVQALDDQLVAVLEPALDQHLVADRAIRDQLAHLDLAVGRDDHRDRVALRIA